MSRTRPAVQIQWDPGLPWDRVLPSNWVLRNSWGFPMLTGMLWVRIQPQWEFSGGFVALGVPDGADETSVALGVGSTEPEGSGDSAPRLVVSGDSVGSLGARLDAGGATISDAVAMEGVNTNAAITTPARPRLRRVAHDAVESFILWLELCCPSYDAPAEACGCKVFLLRRAYASAAFEFVKAIFDSQHSLIGQ